MPKLGMELIRKEQVIKATERCIIEKGLSNMSIKDIASKANVSTGIIYHYFKNKEDLLLQVIKESFGKSHKKVMETVEPLNSFSDKLNKHIENINAVPKENPDFYSVLLLKTLKPLLNSMRRYWRSSRRLMEMITPNSRLMQGPFHSLVLRLMKN